jgi:hypothetical protein
LRAHREFAALLPSLQANPQQLDLTIQLAPIEPPRAQYSGYHGQLKQLSQSEPEALSLDWLDNRSAIGHWLTLFDATGWAGDSWLLQFEILRELFVDCKDV